MPCCIFRCTEGLRNTMGILLFFGNVSLSIFGFLGNILAIYIHISLEKKALLIKNYQESKLVVILAWFCSSLCCFHLVGSKCCYDMGFHKTRKKCENVFFLYIFLSCVAFMIVVALYFTLSSEVGQLVEGLEDGMHDYIGSYRNNLTIKEVYDRFQTDFKCCGVTSHQDWLTVLWNDEVYDKFKKTKKSIPSQKFPKKGIEVSKDLIVCEDVPYSCCNPEYPGPCVYKNIRSAQPGYKYNFLNSHTLYKVGCVEALLEEVKILVRAIQAQLSTVLFIEFSTIVLAQYLESSVEDANKSGFPKAVGTGYLLEESPCISCSPCCLVCYAPKIPKVVIDVQPQNLMQFK